LKTGGFAFGAAFIARMHRFVEFGRGVDCDQLNKVWLPASTYSRNGVVWPPASMNFDTFAEWSAFLCSLFAVRSV
jgi:hypothetical protein